MKKIAVNTAMAGCLPEYLPWVIAAVEAQATVGEVADALRSAFGEYRDTGADA